MKTAQARRRRPRWWSAAAVRTLLPSALIVSVAVLFAMVWQSLGDQSSFAGLERDGVRYIQALVPLETALTNAEAVAVNGGSAPRDPLARAIAAVADVDKDLNGRLRTQDRWAGLRSKAETLPAQGAPAAIIAAYGSVNDLLLALMDKIRDTSKLIRDPAADSYYLEDGAAQELPEGIVAAADYTNLLINAAGQPAADQAEAVVDINAARSDLSSNAQDLSDDVRLAVEGSSSSSLGTALLSKLDRFNRSIDNLKPLVTPLATGKGGIDTAKVVRARDETQAAAADLSVALLAQIDIALRDRLSSLDHRRLLSVGILAISALLVLVPIAPAVAARRRRARTTRGPDPVTSPPVAAHRGVTPPAAGHPVTAPPDLQPARMAGPESGPQAVSSGQYAQWERYGAPQ
jgi:hypothetical protein